jgi:hypothetical protein
MGIPLTVLYGDISGKPVVLYRNPGRDGSREKIVTCGTGTGG